MSVGIDVAVKKAQRKARELEDTFPALSEDERAMISLYTMELHPKERSVYFAMNAALRDREREAVKVWRSAIWLLVTAMNKLPREKETVLYRGVKKAAAELGREVVGNQFISRKTTAKSPWVMFKATDFINFIMLHPPILQNSAVGRQCEKGKVFLWCGFSSTTSHVEGLQAFLGTSGPRTKWTLKLRPGFYGVDIRLFSFFPKEFEVLLPPQLEFEVKSVLDCGNGFIEVQCVQLEETDPILDFVQAQAGGVGGPCSNTLGSSAASCFRTELGEFERFRTVFLWPHSRNG